MHLAGGTAEPLTQKQLGTKVHFPSGNPRRNAWHVSAYSEWYAFIQEFNSAS